MNKMYIHGRGFSSLGRGIGLAKREIEQTETFTEEGDELILEETTTLEIRTEQMAPL